MKDQSIRRRIEAEDRGVSRAAQRPATAAAAAILLSGVLLGSPQAMVKAEVVHGEKIESAAPAPASTTPAATATNRAPAAPGSTNLTTVAALGSKRGSTNTAREFVAANGGKYVSVSFAELASFEFKALPKDTAADGEASVDPTRERLPAMIRALSEKSVAITGFMLPVHTRDGVTSDFLLLRNQSACCYGVMPQINEWVVVRTSGKGVKAIMDTPITALGSFHVGALSENGKLTGIYSLNCDQIIIPKE